MWFWKGRKVIPGTVCGCLDGRGGDGLFLSGCTGPLEYLRNGLKVGPNYHGATPARGTLDRRQRRANPPGTGRPGPMVVRLSRSGARSSHRYCACRQNLTLREAGLPHPAGPGPSWESPRGISSPRCKTPRPVTRNRSIAAATPQTYTMNSTVTGTFTPVGGPPPNRQFRPVKDRYSLIPPMTTEGMNAG